MDAKQRDVYRPDTYIFGDGVGEKVANVKRAWMTAVLKAAGLKPEWAGRGALAPTSRMALASIDLHFHDLRHEAGCRWFENGVRLHHVQELLGHTSLAQTSTHLHASEFGLRESMRRFNASRGTSAAQPAQIDPPPPGHEEPEHVDKSKLH
jgi:integrase